MGRLSPRTRNAQVALYQDKEVDFLVATDAIGMGLNMDVDHVAFAGLGKFDGHRPRRLTPAEVAQIAGRAGRGMRDGTFGTTGQCPPLGDEVAAAVEAHSFDALEQLCWRNGDLDFSHVDALLDTLMVPPPGPGLVQGQRRGGSGDAGRAGARAGDPAPGAGPAAWCGTLWEACQIPDFRKLADDTHTRLCARVFGHIAKEGALPTDWLAGQIAALARAEGDIDTLMQRLAGVRVWSYIAARADWVRDAPHWQARAREVEDLLSDALHEQLTSRFVDRRAAHLMRRLEAVEARSCCRRSPAAARSWSRAIRSATSTASGSSPTRRQRATRRSWCCAPPAVLCARRCPAGSPWWKPPPTMRFALTDDLALTWDGAPIARLRRGTSALRPRVQILDSEFLDGAQRERLRVRLQTISRRRGSRATWRRCSRRAERGASQPDLARDAASPDRGPWPDPG